MLSVESRVRVGGRARARHRVCVRMGGGDWGVFAPVLAPSSSIQPPLPASFQLVAFNLPLGGWVMGTLLRLYVQLRPGTG